MEKYSQYRDSGTGIQPFLTLVPTQNPTADLTVKLLTPLLYLLGAVRFLLLGLIFLLYCTLVEGICRFLLPSYLRRSTTWFFTWFLSRAALFIIGLYRLPVQYVNKYGRPPKLQEYWSPRAGDIIISNHISWVEILWLAASYDPVFLRPIPGSEVEANPTSKGRTEALTGHKEIPILQYQLISMLNALHSVGEVPLKGSSDPAASKSLENIRRETNRPLVLFPECTTSNGRGLLRFSNVFPTNPIPVKGWRLFIMCVRVETQTAFRPSLSHSIPTRLNPLWHIFTLCKSLAPSSVSIRLLIPSESPSSPTFIVSEFMPNHASSPSLSEVCSLMIAQMGKIKRVDLGWEEKAQFLHFYRKKQNKV